VAATQLIILDTLNAIHPGAINSALVKRR